MRSLQSGISWWSASASWRPLWLGHGDVAEEEAGSKGSCTGQAVGCRVDGFGLIAVGFEDELKGVGYKMVVVDDQYTLFHETPRALLH